MTEALQVMTPEDGVEVQYSIVNDLENFRKQVISQGGEENEQGIIRCKQFMAANYFEMGERLLIGEEEEHWRDHGCDSFWEWVRDPNGIDLPSGGDSQTFKMMRITRILIRECNIPAKELIPYDKTKLELIASVITPDNKEAMMGLLKNSRQDLRESLAEKRNKKTPKQERFENGFKGGAFKLVPVNPGCEKIVTFSQMKSLGPVPCEVFKDGENSFMVWIEG